ncbi:MAG: preprotein translocase subunit SecG [Thermodesulfobacteriota bacterium]
MNTLILTIHIIACVSLVALVLMQSGQQGMGVIFGGSSSSLFGSSGAGSLLAKLTIAMAIIFFFTSLGFTYIDSLDKKGSQESVVLEKPGGQQEKPSAVPGQKNTQGQQSQDTGKSEDDAGQASQNDVDN